MTVSPARKIAFDVLRRVEAEAAFAADLLHARLERAALGVRGLKPEDAALATELTLGVLRWQRLLDALLEHQVGKPVAKLDLEVLVALRLGLYQIRWLERVPAYAAIHESVELTKQARKRSAAGMVNAVLRRAATRATGTAGGTVSTPEEESSPNLLPAQDEMDSYGVLFSHPTWLVRRWIARLGDSRAIQLLGANNHPPRNTCILHDESHRSEAADSLRRDGLTAEPAPYLRAAWTIRRGHAAASEAFRRGWISVQDEASQMVALLLDVRPGQRVLDLCAAPGGKTVTLARAAGADGLAVAADVHVHRLHLLRGNLERVGATNVRLLALDAQQPLPISTQFDRILVDAPCSGTGTLARNPEIRWRLKPEDLPELAARQVAILRSAFDALAPGGRLVYSTCSLEPEENELVVKQALATTGGLRLLDGSEALRPYLHDGANASTLFDDHGYFRTWPHVHGTDGFFAAVIERTP